MKTEYLLFNFLIIICPIIGGFLYPKAIKLQTRATVISVGFTAVVFILIDQIVTGHFWTFNSKYILGPMIGKIPFEEALFFFTVPLATLFLWVNAAPRMASAKVPLRYIRLAQIGSLLGAIYTLSLGQVYTAGVLTVAALVLCTNIVKDTKIWKFQLFVLPLTLVFNTYLTARPIVMYNPLVLSGISIGTIPIEDFIYGVILIMVLCASHQKAQNQV